MGIIQVGLLGALAEAIGLSIGIISLVVCAIKSKKIIGMLFGGTSGLMLAMICFDIIPEALEKGRIELVFIGMMIGVLTGFLLDEIVPILELKMKRNISSMSKTGIILVLGVAFHNYPEGFALGALGQAGQENLIQFAIVMALHSIPEGIAFAIPLKQAEMHLNTLLVIAVFLGCIMGLGAMSGFVLSGLNEGLISTGLGLGAGLILYIVCGELLPESKKIWNGRLTTFATILGLMLGIYLLCH